MDLASPVVSGTSVYANGLNEIESTWYCIGFSSRKIRVYERAQRCGANGAGGPAESHVIEAVGRR